MVKHGDKAPTNALIAQAIQGCADRGIRYLSCANFSYSLAEFKRHNGFEKIEIPRYYVPLTIAGRVALRFGLHHEAIDWVPGRSLLPIARRAASGTAVARCCHRRIRI
jgi:hypothetical protein